MSDFQLFMGDCLEVMKDIPDNSIDAVICDPPYGTTACKWDSVIPLEEMWSGLWRITKSDAPIVLFGTQPFTSSLIMSQVKYFKYDWVWHKSKCGSAFTAKYRPLSKHESILVFGAGVIKYNPQKVLGKAYKRVKNVGLNNHKIGFKNTNITINDGFRYPITVQKFQQLWRRQDQIHPTQKPLALMEYLVKTYTNEGDTVLDFTMGSGTTGVACLNTKRKFIGIEKDSTYYNIAKSRIEGNTNVNELF